MDKRESFAKAAEQFDRVARFVQIMVRVILFLALGPPISALLRTTWQSPAVDMLGQYLLTVVHGYSEMWAFTVVAAVFYAFSLNTAFALLRHINSPHGRKAVAGLLSGAIGGAIEGAVVATVTFLFMGFPDNFLPVASSMLLFAAPGALCGAIVALIVLRKRPNPSLNTEPQERPG